MFKERFTATKSWATRHPRRFVAYLLGSLAGLFIIFQLLWPAGTLVPFSSIENTSIGGSSKADAVKVLDEKFKTAQVGVYLNASESAFFKATPVELGVASSNHARVQAMDYPWYLRFVPGSIFWAHFISDASVAKLEYQRNADTLANFVDTKFGGNCQLGVRNASAEVKGATIQAIEAFSGGECELEEVTNALSSVKPTTEGARVSIAGTEILPVITTKDAEGLVGHVNGVIHDGIEINDGKDLHMIREELLVKWLDFAVIEGKLDYAFNSERSASYLGERIASVVEKPTGTMTITLKDFAESGRDVGQSGIVFNREKMLQSMKATLEKGEKKVAVEVDTIPPTVQFIRTYSPADEALSALIKKYADTHPGTYGVSFRELSGDRRNASYRAATQYTTASTYKLFVAYSTLLRVESGKYHWSDYIAGGRNLTECFADMIELSDNECAVALLKKATYKGVTEDARAIGATNTSLLIPNDIKSTAEDESLLLGLLQSGQILAQQSSRDTWIAAMKGNVYRQGIPRGIPSAAVANKVGFMDGWLHDASIVYSPSGTYVLTILTENSSWANIAELANQIETLRTKST